jgi:hypothetical protein
MIPANRLATTARYADNSLQRILIRGRWRGRQFAKMLVNQAPNQSRQTDSSLPCFGPQSPVLFWF